MRRGRIFFYLAFIIILGLLAFVLVWQRYLMPQGAEAGQEAEVPTPVIDTVNVIVVTQRVQRGSALDADVLGMVPIQRELFIQGMYTDMGQVKGQLAKFDLDSGIPLTTGMLVDSAAALSTTGSVAALSIPRGMVSVSIPIDRLSSVSYAPQPGDHVNLIATLQLVDLDPDFQTKMPNSAGVVIGPGPMSPEQGPTALTMQLNPPVVGKVEMDTVLGQTVYVIPSEDEGQRPRIVSQSLLQDAVVLHVGEFEPEEEIQPPAAMQEVSADPTQPAPPPGTEENEAEQEVPEQDRPNLISLIVTPQDAVTLNYLIYSGARLTLALRSAGDDTRVQTEAVTLQYLLDQYNIPVPAKLPYGIPNRSGDDPLEPYTPAPEPTATPVP